MGGYIKERSNAYGSGGTIFNSAFRAANPYTNTVNAAQNPLSFSTGGLLGGSSGVATFDTGGAGIKDTSLTGGLSNQNNSYALIAIAAYFGYSSFSEWAAAEPAAAAAASETAAAGGGTEAAAGAAVAAGGTAASPSAPAASDGVPVSSSTTMTTTNPVTGATQASGTGTFGTGSTGAVTSNAGSFDALGNWASSPSGIGTLANLGAGYLQGQSAQKANEQQAAAQLEAARIAAEAAKFRPVGVTTGFGASQFGYDRNGRLVSAGYQLTPEMKRQRDLLIAQSGGMLDQAAGAQQATAPMGQAAQSMFNLGQGYLGTSPQEQAAKYMAEQQALLSTGRERDMAALQNRLVQQGRLGLATGGTGMMGAANPELEAFYNAQRQQDLGLAAQATQGGMDYAKFGAGMVGMGGTTLQDMYRTQAGAYDPYRTALTGATTVEGLGQGAMDIGTSIGGQVSTAGANAGRFLTGGQQSAASYQTAAQSYNPYASLLGGVGQSMNQYSDQNKWSY